jgi:uncharacterized protein YecE (DUF72 family)
MARQRQDNPGRSRQGTVRIGTSGWNYRDWKGPFYPPEVPARRWLESYAERFATTEINGSFYRLPSESTVAAWHDRTPAGFVFAWKASRFITHNKKLKDCADSIALVYGRMAPLKEKFGPVLFQLPPQLRRNDERLAAFLKLLPNRHRAVVEFRDPGWYDEAVFDLLRAHDVALCLSDHAAAPAPWVVTASFVYVRPHGPGGRYAGNYDEAWMDETARRMAAWRAEGRDVYCFFDNDQKSAAPADAAHLIGTLA